MFWKNVGLRGGPWPVRAYLPDLLKRVWDGTIEPGKVFDLTLPWITPSWPPSSRAHTNQGAANVPRTICLSP